jgi:MYXO-CTERM domain-containing protein
MGSSAPGILRNPSAAAVLALAGFAAAAAGFAWPRGPQPDPAAQPAAAAAPEPSVGATWEGPSLRPPREVERDVWTARRSGPVPPLRRRRALARPDPGAVADIREAGSVPAAAESAARPPAGLRLAAVAAPVRRAALPRPDREWLRRPAPRRGVVAADERTRRALAPVGAAPPAPQASAAVASPAPRRPSPSVPSVPLHRLAADLARPATTPAPRSASAARPAARAAPAVGKPAAAPRRRAGVPPPEFVLGTLSDLEDLRLGAGRGLRVGRDGALGGSGALPGSLRVAGRFAPGHSPGRVEVEGDFALEPDAVLEIELAGTAPEEFDRVVVQGTATLSGVVRVLLLDDFVPALGDRFEVLLAQAIEDAGAVFELPDLGPDRFLQLSLLTGDAGQSLVLSAMVSVGGAGSAVPEPGAGWLGAAGLVGLALHGRRRRGAQLPVGGTSSSGSATKRSGWWKSGAAPGSGCAAR